MIDSRLLEILVCPVSKQSLRLGSDAEQQLANRLIDERVLSNISGQIVADKIDALLIREDGKVAYPVRNEIPVMLKEEGIVWEREGLS